MSDLTISQGETLAAKIGPVTRTDPDTLVVTPVDLALANTELWFYAKAKETDPDTDAVIQKTYVAGGASNGITVTISGSNNTGLVTVGSSETAALEVRRYAWALKLKEPDGRETILDKGSLFVGSPVVDAV